MALNLLSTANHALQTQLLRNARSDDYAAALLLLAGSLTYAAKGTLWDKPDPYHHKLFEKPQQREGGKSATKQTDQLQERLELEGADVAILWASQSGVTERLAGSLAKDLRRNLGAKVLSLDISEVSPASLVEVSTSKIVIVMASTFGEGDPSDNLKQTWTWLKDNAKYNLSNIRFMGFGLGNSKYKHYNEVINVLEAQLLARGATMLMTTGKADDAAGETDEHFLEWKQKVLAFFQNTLGYQWQEAQFEPSMEITEDSSVATSDLWCGIPYTAKTSSSQSKYVPLSIAQSHDLLQNSTDRKCLHLELEVNSDTNLKYKTGDHLAVWPINPALEVHLLLETLGLQDRQATPLRIKSLEGSKCQIPSPCTLAAIFQSYLEICAPVSRENIKALIAYAPNAAAQDFLNQVCRDRAAHTSYSRSQYLNLGRLLRAACSFPGAWSSIPLALVLEIVPAMQPRFYSISSSSVVSPRQIAVTVAVSDTATTDTPDRVLGLATNYLLSTSGGSHPRGLTYTEALPSRQVYASVRKSTFKLPLGASAPVLMVGAGSGIAPFRGFVQERARLKAMGREIGPTRLLFGCRNAAQDSLYAEEFAQWETDMEGAFSSIKAYSRPSDNATRRYVQDAIREDAEEVYRLLFEENAYFYICGSAAMARDVSAAVAEIVKKRQGWGDEEMKEWADRQKRQRRWMQDVWG